MFPARLDAAASSGQSGRRFRLENERVRSAGGPGWVPSRLGLVVADPRSDRMTIAIADRSIARDPAVAVSAFNAL
jgi:hypothetical protein